jgi:heme/copper-type cytochrome/quinol oxidase subunit 3
MICLVKSVFFQAGKASNRLVCTNRVFEEITGLYWHFVDVVWIFLFVILYVI